MIKHVREDLIKMVGYTDTHVEPRTDKESNQKRADISYKDKTDRSRHVHYYTDDTIGHPLCKTHIKKEMQDLNAQSTIKILEKNKEKHYSDFIRKARAHPTVIARARVVIYRTTAFTSLGEMGEGSVNFFNGSLSYYKAQLTKESRHSPRPDGLTPKHLTASLRFEFRVLTQFAIAQGNAAIATSVGL